MDGIDMKLLGQITITQGRQGSLWVELSEGEEDKVIDIGFDGGKGLQYLSRKEIIKLYNILKGNEGLFINEANQG